MKNKTMCIGCYNDDYNNGLGSSRECWEYENAKIERKMQIHINQCPPYDLNNFENRLNCYRKPQYVFITKESLNSEGFWK